MRFTVCQGGDVSTLLEFLKTSEATAADADSGGASGASESLSSEALVSYADAPENASSLRQTQVRLVDELRIREEAFLKPCCQSASEAFRELRSDRWSCQVPPPLAPLVAVESEGEEEGEARQSAEAQNPEEDKDLRLLRRRASRQLLCEAAVERLRKTLPSNRELFARLLSPAVSTGSASARLQLPALGEGDSTVYLDRALSSKSWLLDSLHGRAQALRAAESLLLSRPLHTNARDAVAAARSGEARRRERFEREAGRRTAQSGKEKLQEENSDDEDEGAEDAFGVPLDLDEVRASQGSPFAEAAAQLEAALKSATQTVGLLGVHEQALYAEELSALFQRKRLKGASGVQRKTRGAAPTPSAASPSAVSESEGEGELESEYASECLSEDDAFDCLAAAAEASCPVVLIPLQPPEAEQVRAFVEAHESLLDELLQDAEKGEPISFEKVVDEEMRAVARSRLQWLGSPNVAYDGSASDFMHLLYSSLLNQFGVEDPLQSETPPAAAETHNAAETDECVLAKVLASTEEDKFSFPRCAQTPPPASLAGAVQRILTVLEKESGCAFEEEGRSHPQDFAESQLQRLPQEIRGEAVETEGEPEAEGGSAANRPSEARGAEVWNLKAFLGGAREGAFKLRPSTNAFSEAAGGGAGRALPLRLESACSFATSKSKVCAGEPCSGMKVASPEAALRRPCCEGKTLLLVCLRAMPRRSVSRGVLCGADANCRRTRSRAGRASLRESHRRRSSDAAPGKENAFSRSAALRRRLRSSASARLSANSFGSTSGLRGLTEEASTKAALFEGTDLLGSNWRGKRALFFCVQLSVFFLFKSLHAVKSFQTRSHRQEGSLPFVKELSAVGNYHFVFGKVGRAQKLGRSLRVAAEGLCDSHVRCREDVSLRRRTCEIGNSEEPLWWPRGESRSEWRLGFP